jgi:hypothetical protein
MLACAAEIIEEAYLTFRKNTWETSITKIEDREDALVIHDGKPFDDPQGFVKFPDDVVPNNKRAQLGVLTAWTCHEPYAFTATLIEKSLSGKCLISPFAASLILLIGLRIGFEEISVTFKTVTRPTTFIHFQTGKQLSNWPGYTHTMLRVKSHKSGKQWVLDIARGQYGFVDACHDWTIYENAFVKEVTSVFKFGTQKRIMSALAEMPGAPTVFSGVVGKASAALEEGLVAWETQNLSIPTLRALGGIAFTDKKASLLHDLDKAVRTFISTNNFAEMIHDAMGKNTPIN